MNLLRPALGLARGLPGADRERAEQRRFAEEHRETPHGLGK
jgi:hypothetical protein